MSEQAAEPTPADPTPASTEPSTHSEGGTSDAPRPDVSEIERLMDQRLERYEQERNPAPPVPTLTELMFGAEDAGHELDPDAVQAQETEPNPLQEKVDGLEAYLVGQEQARRHGEIEKIQDEYKDTLADPASLEKLADILDPIADQYGDEAMTDPRLIRAALVQVQAESASAAETPAEQARNRGASLETDAGASGAGEVDPIQAYKDSMLNAGGKRSVFG